MSAASALGMAKCDVFLQAKRDGAAVKRFLKRLLRSLGSEPRKIVTDKLRSDGVAHRELIPEAIHSTNQYRDSSANSINFGYST